MRFPEKQKLKMTDGDTFGVGEIFTEYNDHLEKEAEVKERLREVSRSSSVIIIITHTFYTSR